VPTDDLLALALCHGVILEERPRETSPIGVAMSVGGVAGILVMRVVSARAAAEADPSVLSHTGPTPRIVVVDVFQDWKGHAPDEGRSALFAAAVWPAPGFGSHPVFSANVSRACPDCQSDFWQLRTPFLALPGGQNGPGASARGVGGVKC